MKKQTALLLIDVQKAFDNKKWGLRNNPLAEKQIQKLLFHWRSLKLPVIHIQHISDSPLSLFHPSNAAVNFKEEAIPIAGEKVIRKKKNSAFIGTDLEDSLRQLNIVNLMIVGFTTPHCVSTTARMSANLGFGTFIVKDATASFELTDYNGTLYDAHTVHETSLLSLHNEFANIASTKEIISLS